MFHVVLLEYWFSFVLPGGKSLQSYDPLHRNPLFCGADHTTLWELQRVRNDNQEVPQEAKSNVSHVFSFLVRRRIIILTGSFGFVQAFMSPSLLMSYTEISNTLIQTQSRHHAICDVMFIVKTTINVYKYIIITPTYQCLYLPQNSCFYFLNNNIFWILNCTKDVSVSLKIIFIIHLTIYFFICFNKCKKKLENVNTECLKGRWISCSWKS